MGVRDSIMINILAKSINVGTPGFLQNLPIYTIIAAAILAFAGIALWKTTVGKILITVGVTLALAWVAFKK